MTLQTALPYFYLQGAHDFVRCSICLGTNRNSNGGTVAHQNGGKHPVHWECLLEWNAYKQLCPACNALTDLSPIISSSQKYSLLAKRTINNWIEKSRNWFNHPMNQLKFSATLAFLGWQTKKYPAVALGMSLHAYAIYQIVKYGGGRIDTTRKILQLARELIANPTLNNKRSELENLTGNNHLSQMKVEDIEKFARYSLYADRFIRLWGVGAATGALFLALKSTLQAKKNEPILKHRDDCMDSYSLQHIVFKILLNGAEAFDPQLYT